MPRVSLQAHLPLFAGRFLFREPMAEVVPWIPVGNARSSGLSWGPPAVNWSSARSPLAVVTMTASRADSIGQPVQVDDLGAAALIVGVETIGIAPAVSDTHFERVTARWLARAGSGPALYPWRRQGNLSKPSVQVTLES